MGGIISRTSGVNQVVEIRTNNAYRYPPKAGSYFSNYFIMGGERFDMPQPESYLFGDNDDLNFIGSRPTPFPYPNAQGNEPTKMLKSLVNIRKSSLRFIKTAEPTGKSEPDETTNPDLIEDNMTRYNVEFTFDADIKCAITIYYFATEEIVNGRIIYHPRDENMNSETYHYKQGANQTFSQSSHIIDPSKFLEQDWQFDSESNIVPVVVHCLVEDEEHVGHSHVTFATVDLNSELGYVLKPLKQKQFINGLTYLLQEIYGIENKNPEKSKDPDDDFDETGAECIICMSEMRDTLILPCRHLCLCSGCAESLRYQSSNCPICRSNFRALLQLRAMRKKQHQALMPRRDGDREETVVSQEGVPIGYEAVSLFEALNGPCVTRTPTNETTQTRVTARTDGTKADKKRQNKRHHGNDTRAHDRTTVVNETEGIEGSEEAVVEPPIKSPTHSSKKSHAPHVRHGVKSAEKRANKPAVADDTKDSTEKTETGVAVCPIIESDPAADDADDEQSSDEEAINGETVRPKASSAIVDKEMLSGDHASDTDSQDCDHIELENLNVEFRPSAATQAPPPEQESPIDAPTPDSLTPDAKTTDSQTPDSPTPETPDSPTPETPGSTPEDGTLNKEVPTNGTDSFSSVGSGQGLLPTA